MVADKPAPVKKKPRPRWQKILWLIFKIVRIPVLAIAAIYIGLWVGYTKFGNQPSSEILHVSTWRHLYDLVFAN